MGFALHDSSLIGQPESTWRRCKLCGGEINKPTQGYVQNRMACIFELGRVYIRQEKPIRLANLLISYSPQADQNNDRFEIWNLN